MRYRKNDGEQRKLTCHPRSVLHDPVFAQLELSAQNAMTGMKKVQVLPTCQVWVWKSFLQLNGSFLCPASFMLMPAVKGVPKQSKNLNKDKVCLAFAYFTVIGRSESQYLM